MGGEEEEEEESSWLTFKFREKKAEIMEREGMGRQRAWWLRHHKASAAQAKAKGGSIAVSH